MCQYPGGGPHSRDLLSRSALRSDMVYSHAKMAVFTATLKCRILVFSSPKQDMKTSLRHLLRSRGAMGHRPKVNEEMIESVSDLFHAWGRRAPKSITSCTASRSRFMCSMRSLLNPYYACGPGPGYHWRAKAQVRLLPLCPLLRRTTAQLTGACLPCSALRMPRCLKLLPAAPVCHCNVADSA